MEEIEVETKAKTELIDITHLVEEKLKGDGVVTIFVPHTTAAVTINENGDPDVKKDLLWKFSQLSPDHTEYSHFEGNSDAHVLSSLIGCSLQVIFKNGKLVLGTWQSIYFCEFDGPRKRKIYIQCV